ncbi:MAG: tetratricopeptide repeat protein [Opitutales bacterium]|nr:tetratricopeptide repeat protein [Opitutales bacterium]
MNAEEGKVPLSMEKLYHLRIDATQRPDESLKKIRDLLLPLKKNHPHYVELLLIQARLYLLSGAYPEAENLLQESEKLAVAYLHAEQLAETHCMWAVFYRKKGDPARALEHLQTAAETRRKLGETSNWPFQRLVESGCYWELGQMDEAMQSLTEGLAFCEKHPDDYDYYPDLLNQAGNIYFLLKRYPQAIEYYRKALKIVTEERPNLFLKAALLGNLGEVYAIVGDHNSAMKYNAASLELEEEMGNISGVAYSHRTLATSYLDMGNLDAAQENAEKSLELQRRLNNSWGIGYGLQLLGEIAYRKAQYEDAENYLLEAIELSRKHHALENLRSSYRSLAKIYEGQKSYFLALNTYKAYREIDQEILNEANQRNINELEVFYKTEQKEQQILRMKGEKELQDAQLEAERNRQVALILGIAGLTMLTGLTFYLYLTKRKSNRRTLLQKQALEKANQVLRQVDQEKNDFLNIAAHDIYSPLSSVVALMQHLESTCTDATRKRQLEQAEDASMRVLHLVRSLLDTGRIEAGLIGTEIQPTDVAELVEQVFSRRIQQAEGHTMRLSFSKPPTLPKVKADPTALSQVLENLLGNALKYSPNGAEIIVSAKVKEKHMLIDISNPGIPIPNDKIQRVFDKFARLGDRKASTGKAYGLGLFIVKTLTERMGGTVYCLPDQEDKIVFRLQLNLA